MKIKVSLTPFLWQILINLSREHNCSIVESIRMSILVTGLLRNCVPEEGDDEWRIRK